MRDVILSACELDCRLGRALKSYDLPVSCWFSEGWNVAVRMCCWGDLSEGGRFGKMMKWGVC